MIDEQTLRTLIDAGGVGGTILGVAWIFRPVFLMWLKNIASANELEAKRLENEVASEKDLSDALNGVKTELKLSREVKTQLIDRIDTLPTRSDIDRVGVNMQSWAQGHDARIADLPRRVYDVMAPELDKLPGLIEEKLTPRIVSIEQMIASLDTQLADILDSTNKIPTTTTELVRADIVSLRGIVEELLNITKQLAAASATEKKDETTDGR